jgi:hypothetical protein
MPNNYVLLETIALTQSAASVTFDNLPTSGYTDLKVVMSTRVSATSNPDFTEMSVNGSLANFTSRRIQGNGASATSSSFSNSYAIVETDNFTANTFGSVEIYCPNYRSSNPKSFSVEAVTENNATTSYTEMWAWLWNQTAAITSLGFARTSGTFLAGSTFSLYGIAALGTTPVLAPKANGGNRIENDGTYWIHTFTSSGVFTPQIPLTCDYLVVAGGGGSGAAGGGGGAGGYRTSIGGSSLSVTAQTYPITIGAGGIGGLEIRGTSGTDSIFSSITSTGGGGGGSDYVVGSGLNGGSGGGAPMNPSGAEVPGLGNTPNTSPSQGNDGGAGSTAANGFGGGGGGGASAAGGAGSVIVGGAGGAGTANSISGSSVTYAGGGGGGCYIGTAGAGGAGGGGAGTAGAPTNGNVGTANTGGGAGGSGGGAGGSRGANGGSGIVIIRYPIA